MTGVGDSSNLDELGGMDSEQEAGVEPLGRADTIENLDTGETIDAIELDDATLDPEALIETQQEYAQAEAIEAVLSNLVETAETQGANAPATEEMIVEATDLDGIEAHVREGYDDDGRGKKKGNVEILPTYESGDSVPLEDLGYDHKPIPADEGVLDLDGKGGDLTALDGKGGDITDDRVVKLDEPEGVIPKLDAGEDRTFKFDADEGVIPKLDAGEGVIPKLEIEGGLVDMKFFKVESQPGEEGSLIAKDNAYNEGEDRLQAPALEAALGRAVTDPAFRRQLMADPESALVEYNLSDQELDLIRQVDAERLEQAAGQIREQFEGTDDPAIQAMLDRIISDLLTGPGIVKYE